MARPASGQLWPRFDPSGGSGGGALGFPDNVNTYGATTGDDEEFETDLSSWTFDVTPTSPNAVEVNGDFSPSLLRFKGRNTTGDSVRLYRALTDVNPASDLAVTFKATGTFEANFKAIEVGFRENTNSDSDAITALLHWTTISAVASFYLIRRKYTNIGAGTFSESANVNLGNSVSAIGAAPRTFYMHLQRVSGSWRLFYSNDGATWRAVGAAGSDSMSVGYLHVAVGGFGAAVPYDLSIDWIRLNRFFL